MTPIRIALLYDVDGWATHSDCLALEKMLHLHAPGRFDTTCMRGGHLTTAAMMAFDVVLSTIYYGLAHAAHPRSVSMISSYSYWIRKGWSAEQNTETGVAGWPHLRQWKHMVAHNRHIAGLLTEEDHPDVTLLYHCFDPDMWTPGPCPPHRGLRVGFAGHSQQLKGLHLIREAVAKLDGVELVAPTYERGRIPHDEMPAFYRSLDVYVCASKPGDDAGPRPPIEAGLCGIPVVTTKVGQIGEMIEDGVNGLVVDRTVDGIAGALAQLRDDVQLRRSLAAAVRQSFLQRWVYDVGRDWTNYLLGIAQEGPA